MATKTKSKSTSIETIDVTKTPIAMVHKPITLNASKRKILLSYVDKIVDLSEEKAEFERQKEICKKAFTEFVRKAFPHEEMIILQKWGNASIRTEFTPHYNNCSLESVSIEPTLMPDNSHYYSCYTKERTIDENLYQIWKAMFEAKDNIKNMRNKKISSYRTLIHNAKTLDQVKEVWRDVDIYIVDHLSTHVVIVLTDEEKTLIQNDVQKRIESNVHEPILENIIVKEK